MAAITCSSVHRRSGSRSRRRGTDIQKDGYTKGIRIEKQGTERQTDRQTYVKRNRHTDTGTYSLADVYRTGEDEDK